MPSNTSHIKIFIAYAREDQKVLEQLRKQLSVLENKKLVKVWYDGMIQVGKDWDKEIKEQLEEAEIVVLLISSDFMASEYARGIEMERALAKHQEGTARVFPVIVRDCMWEEEKIATIQVLPEGGKPIQSEHWRYWDTPLKQVVKAISKTANEIKATRVVEGNLPYPTTGSVNKNALYIAFVKKANQQYAQQKWQQAAEKYEKALHLHQAGNEPTKNALQKRIQQCNIEMGFAEKMRLAKAAFKEKNYLSVAAHLEKALQLKPENRMALQLQSRIQELQKEESHNQRATRFNQHIAAAQQNSTQKKWVEAKTDYQQALNLWKSGFVPSQAELQNGITRCETETYWEKTIETAQGYHQTGDYKQALKYYTEALQLKYTPKIEQEKIACENQIKAGRNKAIEGIKGVAINFWSGIFVILLLVSLIWVIIQLIPPPKDYTPFLRERKTDVKPNNAAEVPLGMVLIKGGTFQMGSNEGADDEKPVHEVTLDDFYMDETEVTLAQFERFINATGYKTDAEKKGNSWVVVDCNWKKKSGVTWRGDVLGKPRPKSDYNHPVIHISWNDADAYAKWANKRLPTEAEWEYAARCGSKGYKYTWGNGNPTKSNGGNLRDETTKKECKWGGIWEAYDDGYFGTAPVKQFESNCFGLYDMTDNVWEWCNDWYDSDYYSKSPKSNPQGVNSASFRVLRGGSWGDNPNVCRSASRGGNNPTNRSNVIGFRCAKTP